MEEKNINSRLEAFCDGVFAIAITLLVIDIKLPSPESIQNSNELLHELKHLLPRIFAFLLSFITILITWVNHHLAMKLAHGSSPRFVYANGFLLLTVAFVPFPTSLLGEYVLTDAASPAVALYSAVFALQAIGWTLICKAALNPKSHILKSEKAIRYGKQNLQRSYYAFGLYTLCAITAFWFPLFIAVFVGLTWIAWLVIGINLKED